MSNKNASLKSGIRDNLLREYLASGMTVAEVLHDFPELTETDIRACFAYAADKEKSQIVVYTDETSIDRSIQFSG